MKKHTLRMAIWIALISGVGQTAAYADAFTLTTIPADGNIAGPAGSTVGWGYILSNPTSNWLVTTALSADLFQNGTANALFDLPILAPGATLTVPFDALAGLGLFELAWDATAPTGFVNAGTFTLSAEWWANDPFAGDSFLDFAFDVSAPYAALVSLPDTPAPVPEPSTLLLLTTGLGAIWLLRKRKRGATVDLAGRNQPKGADVR